MVPFHLIYLSRKWTTHFFSSCGVFLWLHLSLSLFHISLSHNFFQSCRLTLPSSLKLCRDTTWSSCPPLGMPLIPTFPSPAKVRSLDCSLAVDLRDIFWWKHPAACSCFLLPQYVAGVSQRSTMDRGIVGNLCTKKATLTMNRKMVTCVFWQHEHL